MKIALFGATGNMGKAIIKIAKEAEIVPFSPSSLENYMRAARNLESDVAIDVSSPDAIELHLSICQNKKIPLVIGTTGIGPDHQDAIIEASKVIPIFQASNFSFGIALMKSMLHTISKYSEDAYIDIIEKHPSTKEDHPSGTALEIASIFESKELGKPSGPRDRENLHIHSIRSNKYAFNHDIRFSFGAEELAISHTCYSRVVYAKGAFKAATFLVNQPCGLYNMDDLIAHIEEKPNEKAKN